MAAKLTRLTHKIVIQLHLVTESCTICSSRSRQPVRKLLVTLPYSYLNFCLRYLDPTSRIRTDIQVPLYVIIWNKTVKFLRHWTLLSPGTCISSERSFHYMTKIRQNGAFYIPVTVTLHITTRCRPTTDIFILHKICKPVRLSFRLTRVSR
jgi:hypothetical protein